jgi:hypothetical protein
MNGVTSTARIAIYIDCTMLSRAAHQVAGDAFHGMVQAHAANDSVEGGSKEHSNGGHTNAAG